MRLKVTAAIIHDMTVSPKNTSPARAPRREKKKPRKITESYLHNAGLFYLQRYSASAGHFRQVMMRKIDRSCRFHEGQNRQDCASLLDTVIEKFLRSGLLNDQAYAQAQVSSLRRRGYGARAILSRLQVKGLSHDIIQEALGREEKDNGRGDLQAAVTFARRRRLGAFRTKPARGDEEKTGSRELAAMARAGFGYETAARALKMDKREAEELLEV